jgi:uncharacterized protein YkuJ
MKPKGLLAKAQRPFEVEGVEMAKISLDNGNSIVNVSDLSDEQCADVADLICHTSDDAVEQTRNELAPCSNREFVTRFCEIIAERGETFTIG